ncbi:N-formylglutamate amidohydrolase [Qipengyuania sp. JC766]|uniref:N-formylglutamate amidohydrolase n=1 Tax=Qipengyuania sp. JC766 TaxID=3232139 RepID=UPI0034595644
MANPPATPILLAAPHAGRAYPDRVLRRMRQPDWARLRLEDRLTDKLAGEVAARTGAALLVAHAPRAMIDLNRCDTDIDWSMVAEPERRSAPRPHGECRARNGLGLVPRRLAGLGEIWRGPISGSDLDARIGQIHGPYHRELDGALDTIHRDWGGALLLDLHSMPPIGKRHPSDRPARFILGDRFGTSSDDRLVATALRSLAGAGATVAHNRPYAGGYILERHGKASEGRHAIQLEICRSLYLDDEWKGLTDGFSALVDILVTLVRNLSAEMQAITGDDRLPQAAE